MKIIGKQAHAEQEKLLCVLQERSSLRMSVGLLAVYPLRTVLAPRAKQMPRSSHVSREKL